MYCELSEKKVQNEVPAPMTFFSPTTEISGKKTKQDYSHTCPRDHLLYLICLFISIDFRMQVMLLYHGQVVMRAITRSTDGCFILQGRVPLGNERIYGPCSAEQLSFPTPGSVALPSCMAETMNHLLRHLERGVLLWVAPDGVFIKRFCQGRVYWSGPNAQYTDRPNKLEREKTFKLLDIATFLNGNTLHAYFFHTDLWGRFVLDDQSEFTPSCLLRAPELFTGQGASTFSWDWAMLWWRISRPQSTKNQEADYGTGGLEKGYEGLPVALCWLSTHTLQYLKSLYFLVNGFLQNKTSCYVSSSNTPFLEEDNQNSAFWFKNMFGFEHLN